MATLAHIFDRFGARSYEEAPLVTGRMGRDACRLRCFPNEDLYFFTKRIDNSTVVRETDPAARRTCWSAIGTCFVAATLVVALLIPSVNNLMSGYKIEALRQERQRLEVERAGLELEETRLLSPQRLEELARMQQFVDPAPQKVVYLEDRDQAAMVRP